MKIHKKWYIRSTAAAFHCYCCITTESDHKKKCVNPELPASIERMETESAVGWNIPENPGNGGREVVGYISRLYLL